jgi:hypothetical protein
MSFRPIVTLLTSHYNRRARDPRLVIESSLATFGEVDQKVWLVERVASFATLFYWIRGPFLGGLISFLPPPFIIVWNWLPCTAEYAVIFE